MARISSGSVTDVSFQADFPTITGDIFEPGFPDCLLQMWAAFLAERAGKLEGKFGCVTPEEGGPKSRALCSGASFSCREESC